VLAGGLAGMIALHSVCPPDYQILSQNQKMVGVMTGCLLALCRTAPTCISLVQRVVLTSQLGTGGVYGGLYGCREGYAYLTHLDIIHVKRVLGCL
jgi:hypothetical protein